jgi:hypothetical protein
MISWCRSRFWFLFNAEPKPDPNFHPDPGQDPDPSFQNAQTLWKSTQIGSYSIHLACHLQIDAYPDPVPDPAYQFHADRIGMRMRIRGFIWCGSSFKNNGGSGSTTLMLRVLIRWIRILTQIWRLKWSKLLSWKNKLCMTIKFRLQFFLFTFVFLDP